MSEHFNGLAPAEAERLAMLAEECAEVIQIVGKILRHGYNSCHPSTGIRNGYLLGQELRDVAAVTSAIVGRDNVPDWSKHDLDMAWTKKLRFAHHQEELSYTTAGGAA